MIPMIFLFLSSTCAMAETITHIGGDVSVGSGPSDLNTIRVAVAEGSSVSVTSGSTFTVNANNFDIRDLAFPTDKVDVSSSNIVVRSSGPISISGSKISVQDVLGNDITTGEPSSAVDNLPTTGLNMFFVGDVVLGIREDTGNLHRMRVSNTGRVLTEVRSSTVGARNADFDSYSNYAVEGNKFLSTGSVTFSGMASSYLFSVLGGSATYSVNSSSNIFAFSGDIWTDDFTPRQLNANLNLSFLQSGATAQLYISGKR